MQKQGVSAASPLTRVYDVSGTSGGPIVRDRLWYFVNAHAGGSTKESTNVYYNLNAGDPSRWLYVPDVSHREYSDRTFENASARVTWQATPRNRFSAFWDQQALCRTCTGATPGLSEPAQISPEAVGVLGRPLHVSQARWWSPLTNRLLVDAGFGGTSFGVGNFERSPNPTRDLIRVAEQCASGCAANGSIPGLVYRSQDFSVAYTGSYLWKGAVSYVTGTHSLKIGYQHTLMTDDRTWYTNSQNLTYRFNNGVPNQLTRVDFTVGEQRARGLGRSLRPGTVDAPASDAAGGAAVRPGGELVPFAAGRALEVSADADRHSGDPRRRQLQGRHAQGRRGVRRVRDRHDGVQDQPGEIPRGRRRVGQLREYQPDAATASDDLGVWHRRRHAGLDGRQPKFRRPTAIS